MDSLTPGRKRPTATRTHRATPSWYFWWSVSKPGRVLRHVGKAVVVVGGLLLAATAAMLLGLGSALFDAVGR